MGEPFLITVDISEIIKNGESEFNESYYTMFIDKNKMSIVYELIEWIRWIFTIEDCFYLMHENSVIHELEDIQLLSKLKTFRLRYCGRRHCVHKKLYRSLLSELDLYTNWNKTKVHKYFVEKITQIIKNLSNENQLNISKELNLSSCEVQMDSQLNNKEQSFQKAHTTSCDVLGLSNINEIPHSNKSSLINDLQSSEKRFPMYNDKDVSHFNKITYSDPKFKVNVEPLKHKSNEKMKNGEESVLMDLSVGSCSSINKTSPLQLENCETGLINKTNDGSKEEQPKKNITDFKKSRKIVKPFSLGGVLSFLREDLKKNINHSTDESHHSNSTFQEGKEEKMYVDENHLAASGPNINGDFYEVPTKKRKRIRKRKRSKKELPVSEKLYIPRINNENNACTWSTNSSYSDVKPNHIRFDVEEKDDDDDDDDSVELENTETKDENETEVSDPKDVHESPESIKQFVNLDPMNVINENKQVSSSGDLLKPEKDEECKNEHSQQNGDKIKPEPEKDTTLNVKYVDKNVTPENFQSGSPVDELKKLLLLKQKFKNPMIIERFY